MPIQISSSPSPEMIPRTAPLCSTAASHGRAWINILWSHIRGHQGSTITSTPRYTQNRTSTNSDSRCSHTGAVFLLRPPLFSASRSTVGPGSGKSCGCPDIKFLLDSSRAPLRCLFVPGGNFFACCPSWSLRAWLNEKTTLDASIGLGGHLRCDDRIECPN